MTKNEEGSTKSLSPTNEHKVDENNMRLTHSDDGAIGRIEGEMETQKKRSNQQNVKIPWQMEELTSVTSSKVVTKEEGQSTSATLSDSIQESKLRGPHKKSTNTSSISQKRKFSQEEDEVTSKEISKKVSLNINEVATQESDEEMVSDAQNDELDLSLKHNIYVGCANANRFELNNPPADEDEEMMNMGKENENSSPMQGLKEDIHEIEGEKQSSKVKIEKEVVKPTSMNEMESSSSVRKNVDNVGNERRIFNFDLNELPLDEDEDHA